jgi:ATP:ADP antiporter, AAA family
MLAIGAVRRQYSGFHARSAGIRRNPRKSVENNPIEISHLIDPPGTLLSKGGDDRPTQGRTTMSTMTGSESSMAASLAQPSSVAGAETLPRLSPLERFFGLFTALRPQEGKALALFFVYALLLLICYYILKTIREPLLLDGGSAELKSYAYAAVASILVVLVPAYGVLFRKTERRQLVRWITLFFAANLAVFYVVGRAGVDIGFVYYVWVGVFSVTILAQFWAHAAHTYNVESGQRLFPVIMAGAALGALIGPALARTLFAALGEWNLMLLAMVLLAATLPLVERTSNAVPPASRNTGRQSQPSHHVLGGFALVMRDRYLMLLAVLAVLLNCVNSTGEYILTELMMRDVNLQLLQDPDLSKKALIAAFTGNYYLLVNSLGLLLQVGLAARLFRWIGVHRAMLVLPVIALIGYGLVAFLPIFGIIRAVKILENSTEYSIANTVRHVLYLPLPAAHQFEGKTAIDTFFWRLGDVAQAGLIYVGLHWLGFDIQQFALLNTALVLVWIAVAVKVGQRYAKAVPQRLSINWRAVALGTAATVVALFGFALPGRAAADQSQLFEQHQPIAIEMVLDLQGLCHGDDEQCERAPATIVYRDGDGVEHTVNARLQVRGKWRAEGGNCRVPPLFVFFDGGTAGTPFDGETMLPLTTHCRDTGGYEQYVLKEYAAYLMYNLFTDKSMRVRLAKITYRDAGRKGRENVVARYGFFTEHFDSLAARSAAKLIDAKEFKTADADPQDLATFELFEYLIGNTDWSALAGHNVTHLREESGRVTPVPYDFDFSGLVDATYAGPPPELPIQRVTQRLFRGFCHPGFDWQPTIDRFEERRSQITEILDQVPDLAAKEREEAHEFIDKFYEIVSSPEQVQAKIIDACRGGV